MAYAIKRKSDNVLMVVDYEEMWEPDDLCYYGQWVIEYKEDRYTVFTTEEDAYHDMWCLVTDRRCNFDDYEIVEVE